ncbi:hypothetical protein CLOM_g12508 [Closterium sp. NIES-68]|nr:hypothetical protein CLOM_g12508 [Closterium sp. NIES-68]
MAAQAIQAHVAHHLPVSASDAVTRHHSRCQVSVLKVGVRPTFSGNALSAGCDSRWGRSRVDRRPALAVRAEAGAVQTPPEKDAKKASHREHLTVGDCMTKGNVKVVKVTTTVDEALEILVAHRISGMPVVDDANRVVGVVSDYDLLALDSISGKRKERDGIFPQAGSSWKAFKEIQLLLMKNAGATVGDVMTAHPLCARAMTNIEDAARVLIESKFHRLPVVDENGTLIGLLTRGNVVRAALMMKRMAEGKGMAPTGGN